MLSPLSTENSQERDRRSVQTGPAGCQSPDTDVSVGPDLTDTEDCLPMVCPLTGAGASDPGDEGSVGGVSGYQAPSDGTHFIILSPPLLSSRQPLSLDKGCSC